LLLLVAFPLASAAGKARKVPTQHHKVERGETLTSIAGLYGMSVKELKSLNHIRKPRRIKAGAKILVRKPETEKSAAVAAAPVAVAPESRLAGDSRAPAEPPAVKDANGLPEPAVGAGGLSGIKEKLVNAARKMLDIPYRLGGSSFMGIDCSGYVQKVFSLLNIMLPRTAREQFNLGTLVGLDNLSIGDLVFFRTYAKFPSHVGIYLGDNRFIHASSKDRKVKIDSLDAPYYIKRFVGARRLPLDEPADEI
jgi:cell wall-associated NlpC family hydrolase